MFPTDIAIDVNDLGSDLILFLDFVTGIHSIHEFQKRSTVCLPVEIIRNFNLSPRARIVWAELSLLPKGAAGEFVVKHKELQRFTDFPTDRT